MSSPGNENAERYPNSGTDDANTITSTSEKQSHTYRIDTYQPVSWLPSTLYFFRSSYDLRYEREQSINDDLDYASRAASPLSSWNESQL